MKISKLLSKILFFAYFFLFIQFVYAQEIKEIWSEIEKKEAEIKILLNSFEIFIWQDFFNLFNWRRQINLIN